MPAGRASRPRRRARAFSGLRGWAQKVWIATRLDIARHWIAKHPPPGGWKPSQLTRTLFVERFGGIYEHSRWVAEAAHNAGLTSAEDSAEGLARAMAAAMARGSDAAERALIRRIPISRGGSRWPSSSRRNSTHEQASAGLDRLSADELARFTALNAAYRARIGFPFVIAVKGKTKAEISAAFEQQLGMTARRNLAPRYSVEEIAALRLREILR